MPPDRASIPNTESTAQLPPDARRIPAAGRGRNVNRLCSNGFSIDAVTTLLLLSRNADFALGTPLEPKQLESPVRIGDGNCGPGTAWNDMAGTVCRPGRAVRPLLRPSEPIASTDREVLESEASHQCRVIEIPAVEDRA